MVAIYVVKFWFIHVLKQYYRYIRSTINVFESIYVLFETRVSILLLREEALLAKTKNFDRNNYEILKNFEN